jgi:hypothetical protein
MNLPKPAKAVLRTSNAQTRQLISGIQAADNCEYKVKLGHRSVCCCHLGNASSLTDCDECVAHGGVPSSPSNCD